MKIIALSDIHGNLIKIRDSCDILVIAGDWSPLYCQHDIYSVLKWIDNKLLTWMNTISTSHIIIIPGNHDLACTYSHFEDDLKRLLTRHNMLDKVHYLNNSSVVLYNKKFYGNPNNESPKGWAFSKPYNVNYNFDKDTDILITHQPPKFGNIGYVPLYRKDLGSEDLKNKILGSNISLNICGHIHTGQHGGHTVILKNNKLATIYNVSILDENYDVAYEPTIIEV